MAISHQPPPPAEAAAQWRPEAQPPMDTRALALGSVSSVVGAIVASAFGGGPIASLICAAISPWITMFLTHPGPHRVRRVVAVLLFAWLVAGCRTALAAVRTRTRQPPREPAPRPTPAEAVAARGWLGHVALTATLSAVLAIGAITAVELVRGDALAADRATTFFDREDTAAPADGPSVVVPPDVVARAGDDDEVRVTYRVTAADAQGDPLTPVCDPRSGALFPLGETTVACSVTDDAGRTARAEFVIAVRPGGTRPPPDRGRPRLVLPSAFTREATAAEGARVTYVARARDARDGPLTPACTPASGTLFALGRTRVACSATDAAGNTARGAFVVTVTRSGGGEDTRAPEISVPPRGVRAAATSPAGTEVAYDVAVVDDRDGTLRASCDPPPGSAFPIGDTRVTCTARDAAGNAARAGFTVTVVDEPPVLELPADRSVPARGEKGRSVRYDASARDAVDGTLEPACTPRSGSFFRVGSHTVSCTATDSAGATAKGTFTITVKPPPDRRPPVIDGPDEDIFVQASDSTGAIVTFTVTARDARDGAVQPTCTPASGTRFKTGKTTVTCTARDAAGNTATPLKFDVNVNPPVD